MTSQGISFLTEGGHPIKNKVNGYTFKGDNSVELLLHLRANSFLLEQTPFQKRLVVKAKWKQVTKVVSSL